MNKYFPCMNSSTAYICICNGFAFLDPRMSSSSSSDVENSNLCFEMEKLSLQGKQNPINQDLAQSIQPMISVSRKMYLILKKSFCNDPSNIVLTSEFSWLHPFHMKCAEIGQRTHRWTQRKERRQTFKQCFETYDLTTKSKIIRRCWWFE